MDGVRTACHKIAGDDASQRYRQRARSLWLRALTRWASGDCALYRSPFPHESLVSSGSRPEGQIHPLLGDRQHSGRPATAGKLWAAGISRERREEVEGCRAALTTALVIFLALCISIPAPAFVGMYGMAYALIMLLSVVPILLISIWIILKGRSLGTVSMLLKIGMFFGCIAFYFGPRR